MITIDELQDSDAGFGIILLRYRQLKNVTLPTLSQETCIPLSVLEKIELGTLRPDMLTLKTLSIFFDEDFTLLFIEEPKNVH